MLYDYSWRYRTRYEQMGGIEGYGGVRGRDGGEGMGMEEWNGEGRLWRGKGEGVETKSHQD